MRILHIIPNFASGGAERVLLNYLLDWKVKYSDDDVVGLALYCNKGSIYDEEISEGHVRVEYANCRPGKYIEYIQAIRSKVKSYQPDIIHSHMRILPYVYFATIGMNVKIVHTIHTEPEAHAAGKQFYLERICMQSKRVLPICLTMELARRANQLYRITKCEYLYNGIFVDQYRDLSIDQKVQVRRELQIPTDAMVIGHVGRFVPLKNHELIIDVFEEYHKNINSKSYLILIGEGPEFKKIQGLVIEKELSDYVKMVGTRRDVPHLLQVMDKYIFPSSTEGLGLSFVEAQAAGLDCVISDAIPAEAVVTKKVTRVSLHDKIDVWVNALEGKLEKESPSGSLHSFDRYSVVDKLRRIYENVLSQQYKYEH